MPAAARTPPIPKASATENSQPQRAELHRPALDPFEVDLVAGEVEEHPEPEVGEEFDEVVGVGEVEDLRADQDPQEELEDDHRRRIAFRDDRDGDRGDRGDQDDREERGRVDVDH